MSDLFTRINRRLTGTWKSFREDCHFSSSYALLRVMDELGGRAHLNVLSDWANKKKHTWVLNYLEKGLSTVIHEHQKDSSNSIYDPNAPIWVCWWTGEEDAPALVRQCIRSIRANAGSHPVHMITRESYSDYLKIPDYILDKVNDSSMCLANFSDYLRFSLLAKFGGLWLDSTIFCSRKIPEDYFKMPVFTCKSHPSKTHYVSKFRWTSFCMGGYKNHVFFRFFQHAMEEYWKNESQAIDYLLVDYLIETAYRNIPAVKTDLDAVPVNNLHRDDLQAAMNAALPATQFTSSLSDDTILYKLSWREIYSDTTADGSESIFHYFKNIQF